MKRWFFLSISIIIFIIAVYLNIRLFELNDEGELFLYVALVLSLILLFVAVYITINFQTNQKIKTLQNRLSMWTKLSYHVNQVGDEVFNVLPIGIIALDDEYEVKWANPHAKIIFDGRIVGRGLKDFNQEMYNLAINSESQRTISIGNSFYDVTYKKEFNFFYLFDVTERERIKEKYRNQIPAIAVIYLDNLDEATSSLDLFEQSSLKGEYLASIADWAVKYKAYLKTFENDRLFMTTNREQLLKMMEDRFDCLDKVREISNKNHVRVSLSIGIASWDIPYEEIGVYAQNAVELAEKRGGDQVVVNIQNQKIAYFGAKNDATQKSSRVSTRVNALTIKEYIEKASHVYIMGHDQADLDAFGSAFAVYHMALISNVNASIIVDYDRLDQTVKSVYSGVIEGNKDLLNKIVTTKTALELMDENSLLIVVDTQSPRMVMDIDVLEKSNQLIVIDHHRASEEGFKATFSYVEPSASSTIELLIELLDFYKTDQELKITPIEASLMYGGLIVDTNSFTYRTSARTFEVASILKELGADTAEVKSWLRKDLDRTLEINKLVSNLEVFLDRFAFVLIGNETDDRILLAQVADSLLQISGIDASFVLARMSNNTVGVSARSSQSVNVQILMETLGGGGHLQSAAAQIQDETIFEVYTKLKNYLELEYSGGETMKIILLEDVKGKGSKDDVIEVANGYGQFLVTHKKAVIATDENLASLNKAKALEKAEIERHINLMKKLKAEIDGKKVTVVIQTGQDGKLFGSVTSKQIVELFQEKYGILIDKKKLELESDINSVGIYNATVNLHKDIKAQFEIDVVEK